MRRSIWRSALCSSCMAIVIRVAHQRDSLTFRQLRFDFCPPPPVLFRPFAKIPSRSSHRPIFPRKGGLRGHTPPFLSTVLNVTRSSLVLPLVFPPKFPTFPPPPVRPNKDYARVISSFFRIFLRIAPPLHHGPNKSGVRLPRLYLAFCRPFVLFPSSSYGLPGFKCRCSEGIFRIFGISSVPLPV